MPLLRTRNGIRSIEDISNPLLGLQLLLRQHLDLECSHGDVRADALIISHFVPSRAREISANGLVLLSHLGG